MSAVPAGQFSQDAGHHFDVLQETANGISLAYSVPMRGYPQAGATLSTAYEDQDFNGDGKPDGRVYLYFTYNTYPGGISVLTDEPGQTSGKAEDLFTPETKSSSIVSVRSVWIRRELYIIRTILVI